MTVPLILFKHIAKACLNQIGGGILGDIVFNIAEDVMDAWRVEKDERSRKEELEAIAQATTDQVKKAVREVVEDVAFDRAESDQEAIAAYLMHVPGAIRRTLRRASDPSGRTLPSGFVMKDAGDLAAILPERLPRFRPGDKPWANVDRELVELLGVGGFGEVWKAINPRRSSFPPVALKFCIDPASKDRLLGHEASIIDRIMAVGPQPGIVRLNETYLTADPPCLEYEFVAGGELTGIIQDFHSRGGISPGGAAKIVERLAKTVGFFHRLQPPIVHRDLKPANILVKSDATGRLTLKIADFGISGLAAGREIERSLTQASRGGLHNSISRGSYTPLYASPEQIRGAPADPRDDVHALGVIWFQLLSGDQSLGAPAGMDWIEDLTDRGMSHDQIRVIASCFSSKLAKRPADAECLAAEIRRVFPPKESVAVVPPAESDGARLEESREAINEVAPLQPKEAIAVVAPLPREEAIAEVVPSESDGDRTEVSQEAVAEVAPLASKVKQRKSRAAASKNRPDTGTESPKLIEAKAELGVLLDEKLDVAELHQKAQEEYQETLARFQKSSGPVPQWIEADLLIAGRELSRWKDMAGDLDLQIKAAKKRIRSLSRKS